MKRRRLLASLPAALAGTAHGVPPKDVPTAAPARPPDLSSRHHDYWLESVEVTDRLGPRTAPPGSQWVIVIFTARNFDAEPRAVFVGVLHATLDGTTRELVAVDVEPGHADEPFQELWMREVRRVRFAYPVPEDIARRAGLRWEPGRAGGRTLELRAPVPP